jgi:uroporphyrinogen-III synthase
MNKRIVFLTRRLDSYEILINELEKKEIELRGFPFIETTSVPFDNDLEAVDWLFFLSPASVIHFFEQVSALPENLKLAALGPGTAAMFP